MRSSRWGLSFPVARLLWPSLLSPRLARALEANARMVRQELPGRTDGEGHGARISTKDLVTSYLKSRITALRLLSGQPQPVFLPDLAHIESAHSKGRGVLVLTAHIGCWELGAASLTRFADVHSVAGIQLRAGWTKSLRKRLRDLGLRIHSSPWALSNLRSALRRGRFVALQMDGDQGERRLPARILGTEVMLPAGAAWLAAKTDCVVLTGACVWEDGRWVGHAEPPLRTSWEDSSNSIAEWHSILAEKMEKLILRWPEQWVLPSPLIPPESGSEARP